MTILYKPRTLEDKTLKDGFVKYATISEGPILDILGELLRWYAIDYRAERGNHTQKEDQELVDRVNVAVSIYLTKSGVQELEYASQRFFVGSRD